MSVHNAFICGYQSIRLAVPFIFSVPVGFAGSRSFKKLCAGLKIQVRTASKNDCDKTARRLS